MNHQLRSKLIEIAKNTVKNDLSHDFNHLYRVLNLTESLAKKEGGDLDIIVPAALFHDIVVYKGTKKRKDETKESASITAKILGQIKEYPKNKINQVRYAISVASFSKNIPPKTLEAKILQDADLLEATGAISIMRTFGSSSVMHVKAFYNFVDPFCKKRKPDSNSYSLDLFFERLLVARTRMHTKTAKQIANRRTAFLRKFIDELKFELSACDDRIR